MFYDVHGGAVSRGRRRGEHLRAQRNRARTHRTVRGSLADSLDAEGIGALRQLFGDAREVVHRGGRGAGPRTLLDELSAAFAAPPEFAWTNVFAALARIEARAVDSSAPALRRIRAFLQENADLSEATRTSSRLTLERG